MAQSLVKIIVHIVFSTKQRKNLIRPELEDELYRYIHGVIENLGAKFLIGNGDATHTHLLVSIGKNEISALVGTVKRSTSVRMKRKGMTNFYWQRGNGAFSVSQSKVQTVSRYIASQKEHHSSQNFKDEFRILCARREVPLDKRYYWD